MAEWNMLYETRGKSQRQTLENREEEHRSELEVLRWVNEHLQGKDVEAWAVSDKPRLERFVRDTTKPSDRVRLAELYQQLLYNHCSSSPRPPEATPVVVRRTRARLKEIEHTLHATMHLKP